MARKRIPPLVAKPQQLRAGWARPSPGEEPSICYAWGGAGADKPDARILSNAFEEYTNAQGRTLLQELEHRGYDLTTLKFSVHQRPQT